MTEHYRRKRNTRGNAHQGAGQQLAGGLKKPTVERLLGPSLKILAAHLKVHVIEGVGELGDEQTGCIIEVKRCALWVKGLNQSQHKEAKGETWPQRMAQRRRTRATHNKEKAA